MREHCSNVEHAVLQASCREAENRTTEQTQLRNEISEERSCRNIAQADCAAALREAVRNQEHFAESMAEAKRDVKAKRDELQDEVSRVSSESVWRHEELARSFGQELQACYAKAFAEVTAA